MRRSQLLDAIFNTYIKENVEIRKYLHYIVDGNDTAQIICRTWFHVFLAPISDEIYVENNQTSD